MAEFEHEQVVFFQNKEAKLKAIVAIHDTTLGPALGGTRMWNYASEEEALRDVLRLSKGMTYKAAAAGLNLGGGKAVIIGDPKKEKSQTMFKMYGRFLNGLGGRYITAEDVNTDVNDMEYVYSETDYVVGIEKSHGGSGDPSPFTALGTFQGIKACLNKAFGNEEIVGKKIAIQGVGCVGSKLIKMLVDHGAEVFVSDIDKEKLEKIKHEFNVHVVPFEEIVTMECDIFSPCALGAIINDDTVEKMKCKIIAGAANNQLDRAEHGEILRKRGVIYAPDYVINAGGLMNVSLELEGYSRERAERMTRGIYYNLNRIFKIADDQNVSTTAAADHLVDCRLESIGKANTMFTRHRKSVLETVHYRYSFHR
jgi:leucine dehydrogenase